MWFLSERFNNEYAKTVGDTYSAAVRLRRTYQSDLTYSALTIRLSHSLKQLRWNIDNRILNHEKQVQTLSGWLSSWVPGTEAFKTRWYLAKDFSAYETLKREITIANKYLSKTVAPQKLSQPKIMNRSESKPNKQRVNPMDVEKDWQRLRKKPHERSVNQKETLGFNGEKHKTRPFRL